jgi:hypothetical protein
MDDKMSSFGFSYDKMFKVFSDWVQKVSTMDPTGRIRYQQKLFATYDAIDSFFRNWMDDTSENRRKYLKLLSDILRLT